MGWFNNSKKDIELIKKTQENLEVTQKNLELMLNQQAYCNQSREDEMDEKRKRQVAYALNFCTISVSQIVDYNDIYILEQEYEAILNNLNLETIPKDEALLTVLKELLNTITFFRIQEDKRKLFEEEYQHNMKNAIWNAVPNLNVIVTGGTPVAILGAVAAQVGIGYMNYRKAKSENEWSLKKQNRQLLQTAMEQFNALRRELFETAWRLADKYNFPDKYRLTERQITQYNQILTDTDPLRRYERLFYIKDYFEAYPPFWFYLGHAAHEIYLDESYDLDDRAEFKAYAISHFYKFSEIAKNNILREDQIAASCALEQFNLIDDVEEKRKLLRSAQKFSGNALDVMEHCAVMYLSIGDLDEASNILKMLVNEGYNIKLNAQLLSRIYVFQAAEGQRFDRRIEYKILQERTSNREEHNDSLVWLYPMPDPGEPMDPPEHFINQQRKELLEWYADLLCEYYALKDSEYQAILNAAEGKASKTEKEKLLVDFAAGMMKDFALLPYAGIGPEEFVLLLRENKENLEKLAKSYSSQSFKEAFGVLFTTAASNIAQEKIETMAQVNNLENGVYQAANFCKKNVAHISDSSRAEDLASFLSIECKRSEKFKRIKELVRAAKDDLLRQNPKHSEVLLEGTIEFSRYIQDHELNRTDIVAIINDHSKKDLDLLITEHRLEIHRWRSAGIKYAIAIGAGMLAGAATGVATTFVAPGANIAISAGVASSVTNSILDDDSTVLVKKVLYNDVDHGTNKLKKVAYANDDVNMTALFKLLDSIRGICEGSVEESIRNAFRDNKDSQPKSLPEEVRCLEA